MGAAFAGANARAGHGGLARISDTGEEGDSEKGVEAEENRSAGKGLFTEERLSPENTGLPTLDGQAISAEENKSKEQTRAFSSRSNHA